jgi:hypothetical protein
MCNQCTTAAPDDAASQLLFARPCAVELKPMHELIVDENVVEQVKQWHP